MLGEFIGKFWRNMAHLWVNKLREGIFNAPPCLTQFLWVPQFPTTVWILLPIATPDLRWQNPLPCEGKAPGYLLQGALS